MLGLPDGVQRYIAAGDVPVDGERLLREIAKVSPAVAECICELAKRNKLSGKRFIDRIDDLFVAASETRIKGAPTMISPSRFAVSEIVPKGKKRKELIERINAFRPQPGSEDPIISFGEQEVDAARAAGCLVEHSYERGNYCHTTAFITDAELAADLLERLVECEEKNKAKRDADRAAKETRRSEDSEATDPVKELRKAQRTEAKEKTEEAEAFNGRLETNVLQGKMKSHRKDRSLARAKALATMVVTDNPNLAGSGLRLVLPSLRTVTVKALKSGKPGKPKIDYADAEQCEKELLSRIDAAVSVEEVLEVISLAFVTAIVADLTSCPTRGASTGARSWTPRSRSS